MLNRISQTFFIVLVLSLSAPGWAEAEQNSSLNFFPSPLLKLDDRFMHNILIAEKSTHKIFLFKNDSGKPKLVKTFKIATGKKSGNKIFQGDFRTPEGIYHLTQFIPHQKLIERYGKEGEQYGVGAFVMDYPNPIDRYQGKTGGGIWLHSTNNETRIDLGLDSRGCIVAANNDLKEISQYIELGNTTLIVVHDFHYLNQVTWEANRKSLLNFVDNWVNSWRNEDLKSYTSNYHPREYSDNFRPNFESFKEYKKKVFWAPGKPEIEIDDLSIVQTPEYAMVTFTQKYKSNSINDIGKKVLYLRKDSFYSWKIVSEVWRKIPNQEMDKVAFRPSMRFFDNNEEQKKENN